jgi:choline dehydrogenase-like flavoprotein
MVSFDYAIIGSGPAGVAAALKLEGSNACLIDVGDEPAAEFTHASLRAALTAGAMRDLLGDNWGMLDNLMDARKTHPKLRAAMVRHVLQGEPYQVFGANGELLINGRGSHAAGGMAIVWGAQLFRYTDADLAEVRNWPITAADLAPHYADLEAHIGISGLADDMESFLGPVASLLPPVPLGAVAERLLLRYQAKRSARRLRGLRLGRPRLGVLTQPYRGRAAYDFGETEFFATGHPGLYTPRHSLLELRARGRLQYLGGTKLVGFNEQSDYVELELEDTTTHQCRHLRVRHLLLGCGAMQTARLLLLNHNEPRRVLPFIDHPPSLLPIFFPAAFGTPLPTYCYPIQLVGTVTGYGVRDMISFYYPGGMLWSDLLPDMPLPVDVASRALRVLMGGMLVAQIWELSEPTPGNRLQLAEDGSIRIDYADRSHYSKLPLLIPALRVLGGITLARLASLPLPTWGFHHAATLPMRHVPEAYETHPDGRLWDSRRVRVIDGSVLPSLPAKNHSLTIMANAARIAAQVKACGY